MLARVPAAGVAVVSGCSRRNTLEVYYPSPAGGFCPTANFSEELKTCVVCSEGPPATTETPVSLVQARFLVHLHETNRRTLIFDHLK